LSVGVEVHYLCAVTPQPWFAVLQYFGRGFAGWQRQRVERTVQGEFEAALERLAGSRVACHAAGRTDAGVHALGQVVSFALERPWEAADLERALNALVPDDLWVFRTGAAPPGFHARKSASARCYRYLVGCDTASRSPFRHPFEWALGRSLDGALLEQAASAFRGTHDFRAFSAAGPPRPHYRCAVRHAEWRARADGQGFIFTIEADRFLHRMVRFLVGISVDVALRRRPLDDIPRLLASTDNQEASPPAPPAGLYLVGARYPELDLERNLGLCSSFSTPRI
jgi:tRNA pseudouridine38-40 synthase